MSTESVRARARQPLEQLPPYVPVPPGGGTAIRLAANETPLGPFPAARAALARQLVDAGRYPELDGVLIERLAALHGVPSTMVALGNGADALIGYLSSAYLEPGDEVLTGWPSFPTYLSDARKQGAIPRLAPLRDGVVDLEAIAERIGPRTKLVWVCTPNNPTGGTVDRDALRRFLDEVPEQVLVLVDEAYFEYACAPEHIDTIREHSQARPNVGALRTFSKIYGLAGLRVGYFVGPAAVAEALGKVRHYYDVGELSNIAALASLDEPDELERRRVANLENRALLEGGLTALGLRWHPSKANFVAVEVGDADDVEARLLAAGIATRSLSPLGEPGLLRITVGTSEQLERLLTSLAELL